jgi:hypothetical protein
MKYLFESILVCIVILIAIIISLIWSGEAVFMQEEYNDFLKRVHEGKGL